MESLKNQISTLNTQYGQLESSSKSTSACSNNLLSTNGKIVSLNSQIDTAMSSQPTNNCAALINQENASYAASAANLNSQLASVNSNINTLNSNLTAESSAYNTCNAQVLAQSQNISSLKASLAKTNANIALLNTNIQNTQAAIQQKISAINTTKSLNDNLINQNNAAQVNMNKIQLYNINETSSNTKEQRLVNIAGQIQAIQAIATGLNNLVSPTGSLGALRQQLLALWYENISALNGTGVTIGQPWFIWSWQVAAQITVMANALSETYQTIAAIFNSINTTIGNLMKIINNPTMSVLNYGYTMAQAIVSFNSVITSINILVNQLSPGGTPGAVLTTYQAANLLDTQNGPKNGNYCQGLIKGGAGFQGRTIKYPLPSGGTNTIYIGDPVTAITSAHSIVTSYQTVLSNILSALNKYRAEGTTSLPGAASFGTSAARQNAGKNITGAIYPNDGFYNQDNGTATGDQYCSGPWGGPSSGKKMVCVYGVDANGNTIPCSEKGVLWQNNAFYCANPNYVGDNGSVTGNQYCAGGWGSPNGKPKNMSCVGGIEYSSNNPIACTKSGIAANYYCT
jgi:hypothetical protein